MVCFGAATEDLAAGLSAGAAFGPAAIADQQRLAPTPQSASARVAGKNRGLGCAMFVRNMGAV